MPMVATVVQATVHLEYDLQCTHRVCFVGELTQEGYTRKMAWLEEPSSSKSICKELSQPEVSVKEKIKELFGRGSSKSCPLPKKKITKQTERNTTVTLVCVDKKKRFPHPAGRCVTT